MLLSSAPCLTRYRPLACSNAAVVCFQFRFFIHMYGTNMGAASVSIIDMHNKKEIWRLFGSQKRNDFVPQVVTLPPSFNER